MDEILVSVIIVNYNTKFLTRDCIISLYKHLTNHTFEIIVVDNNSSDGSVELFNSEIPEVRVIKSDMNYGFGIANNIGVSYSKGRYILLLNSDTIINKDIIDIYLKFLRRYKIQSFGVLGSLLISYDNKIVHSFGTFPFFLRNKIRNYRFLSDDKIFQQLEKSFYAQVDVVVGASMFIERSVYEQFGGFDANIFLYEEELELQFRMRLNGFKSFIINEKAVVHLEGQSSNNYFKRKQSFLSLCYIMKKHLNGYLYLVFRVKWIIFAIIFFKNPRISLHEKFQYLKLTIIKK